MLITKIKMKVLKSVKEPLLYISKWNIPFWEVKTHLWNREEPVFSTLHCTKQIFLYLLTIKWTFKCQQTNILKNYGFLIIHLTEYNVET